MMIRNILKVLAAGVGVATGALSAETKQPNMVFLLADDWRFDTLGVAGNTVVKTLKRDEGSPVHVTRKNEEDAIEFLATRPNNKPFMLNLWFFAPHAEDGSSEQYLPSRKA